MQTNEEDEVSFSIITTVSPEFARAERDLIPTWHANSGADEIVVRQIDAGSWEKNIAARAEVVRAELLFRLECGERYVLSLDADCLVLRDLSSGFSDKHLMSIARWPSVNLGVVFYTLAPDFNWTRWLNRWVERVQWAAAQRVRNVNHECEQAVMRTELHAMAPRIDKLAEWEWNYSEFDLPTWHRDLPKLKDIVRVLHLKGHGAWDYTRLDEKLALAKKLWPKEMACIG